MPRLKVLLSAYACEPGRGSEPGVGWNWVRHLSRHADVRVITRANNRIPIEHALAREPLPGAHFIYFDLPRWLRFWKKGNRGLRTYYYLWQLGAWLHARGLHRRAGFDVIHHVTFVKYWMPSFISLLPAPFIWGPVGGGESAPRPFWFRFSFRGKLHETARHLARAAGSLDPFVRLTARRAAVAMATTSETAACLRSAGARQPLVVSEAGLMVEEIARLAAIAPRTAPPFRLLSLGSLLHLKGFWLGVEAFARFARENPASEYWLIGDGPERARLEALARKLGVADKVRFFGQLSRDVALERLAECDVLVHPSLHDSGGWVCLEAMAAGKPVVCLDLGGPGAEITADTGIKVPANSPDQAIAEITAAFQKLASNPELRSQMGAAGRRRVAGHFAWDQKAIRMLEIYRGAAGERFPAGVAGTVCAS